MSGWNETCMASSLPIRPGHKAVALLIIPGHNKPAPVSTTGYYVPVSLPFTGVYDGYGRLEDVTPDPCALESLSNMVMHESKPNGGPKEIVRPPFRDDEDWENRLSGLFEAAGDSRLFVAHRGFAQGFARVHPVFFHEKLYNELVYRGSELISAEKLQESWPPCPAILHIRREKDKTPFMNLAAADAAMRQMRMAWRPACAPHGTVSFREPWQPGFYAKMADMAKEIWWEETYG